MKIALLVALAPTLAFAQKYEIDTSRSTATFEINHMLVATAKGSINKVSGTLQLDEAKPENSKVTASVALSAINTENEKRDAHLKTPDYFDVEKFPAITFTSTGFKRVADGKFEVAGTLTMHGVNKAITFEVQSPSTTTGERKAHIATVLNRRDFGVGSGGVMMGTDAKVTLDLVLKAVD
jgi:polyisoprenoid-binding protein YceI